MTTLAQLVDAFLETEFSHSPTLASRLGLTEYDHKLDDLSADAFELRDSDAAAFLQRFSVLPDAGLSAEERIDRDLAIAMLRGRLVQAGWQGWRRDPLTYSGPISDGLFSLFLHRLRPEEDLVDAACARLAQAPRLLEQGRANLSASLAHPLIVSRAMASAKSSARYVRELLPNEAQTAENRERLRAAGEQAAQAFERWAAFLGAFASEAHGSWVFGEERYTAVLQEREALAYDARTLRDMGQREFDRLDAEMRTLADRIAGTPDWHEVISAANKDHPLTEEAMRQAYEVWTERARDFLVERGLVSLPEGEECAVEPSPVFQRPVLGVASYMAPPAFSDSLTGHFFVPFAPDGASADEIDSRLENNNHGGIPTTAVHEAYPGHHWHFAWLAANAAGGGARPLRFVFGSAYFVEGWGLYAEDLLREKGFFKTPEQELCQRDFRLFRAARIIVDTSLHLGEMTIEEAVDFMSTKCSLSRETARAEVLRYCAWPTQASSYLTGALEIDRMRRRWVDESRGTLREFHDRAAGSGRLPIGLVEQALFPEVTGRVAG